MSLAVVAAVGCSKDKKADGPVAEAPKPQPGAEVAKPAPEAVKMELVTSPVIGKPAPDFELVGVDGAKVSLAAQKGKTVVLEWFNPECPFVVRSHSKGSLVGNAKKHTDAGVVWLAIDSSAPGKQGHDPEIIKAKAAEWTLTHPVLRDEDGKVGKAYGATNTPNMFVIDAAGTVVYAGAIDNSPDGEGESPAGGTLVNYVDAALADLAAGRPVATPVTKPYGCGVKYGS